MKEEEKNQEEKKGSQDFRPNDFDWSFYKAIKQRELSRDRKKRSLKRLSSVREASGQPSKAVASQF